MKHIMAALTEPVRVRSEPTVSLQSFMYILCYRALLSMERRGSTDSLRDQVADPASKRAIPISTSASSTMRNIIIIIIGSHWRGVKVNAKHINQPKHTHSLLHGVFRAEKRTGVIAQA